MALSANRSLKWGVSDDQEAYNVLTNVHIYKNAFVGWSGAAARPLVAGDIFLGIADTEENNTVNALGTGVGATGDKIIRVNKEGVLYSVAVTGAAAATDLGKAVYASDDGTLTTTATGNSYIGKITKYISTGVADVEFHVGTTIGSITGLTDNTGGTANNTLVDGLTAVALTENAGAIGGTNDGNLPDLTPTAATLTGTLTGTVNGALVDVAATAASTAGGATPTATQVDAGIATAVASIVTGVNEQNKELMTMINAIIADNVALRAAIREIAVMTNTQTTDLTNQNNNDADLAAKINAILNTAV